MSDKSSTSSRVCRSCFQAQALKFVVEITRVSKECSVGSKKKEEGLLSRVKVTREKERHGYIYEAISRGRPLDCGRRICDTVATSRLLQRRGCGCSWFCATVSMLKLVEHDLLDYIALVHTRGTKDVDTLHHEDCADHHPSRRKCTLPRLVFIRVILLQNSFVS